MAGGARLLLVVGVAVRMTAGQPAAGLRATPVNASDGVLAAFDTHSIVALPDAF